MVPQHLTSPLAFHYPRRALLQVSPRPFLTTIDASFRLPWTLTMADPGLPPLRRSRNPIDS